MESIFPKERLTPDITIKGRMPTKEEYADSLRLLRDLAEMPLSAFYVSILSYREQDVLIAMQNQGLVRTRASQPWDELIITNYGKLYLKQRTEGVVFANPIGTVPVGALVVGALVVSGIIWLLTRSSSAEAAESPPSAPPLPIPEPTPPANAPANTPGLNPASTPAAPAANPGSTAVTTLKPNTPVDVTPAPTATPTNFVWIPEPTPCVNSTDCAGNEWCKNGKCVSDPCKSNADCGPGKYCQNGECFTTPNYSTSE